MIRLFETHVVRKQKEITGTWQFCTVSDGGEKGTNRFVQVPSCWESIHGLEDYRGKGVYAKTIRTQSENIRLIFKGVSHTADVFLDGKPIAHHYNAYTEFYALVKNLEKGDHKLEVYVDNSFSEQSALHVANDYRSYGGITRPVILEELDDLFLRWMHVTPILENGAWKVNVKIQLVNLADGTRTVKLRCEIEGQTLDFGTLEVSEEAEAERTFELTNITAWNPENPRLYLLTATLTDESGKAIDDLTDRVGFREIKVEGDKILLNNKRIYLKGFNRHEDYGQLGAAVPVEIMSYDIDTILYTGANTIRTSHYPNDERFLDLCDERGIFVWEEGHARGLSEAQMRNPHFKRQSDDCINEMVVSHYNHPSILMWGILNECASDTEYGRECYALQYGRLRELDKTRPLTSASNKYEKDICMDLADIVSFNIYPRWYIDDEPGEYLANLKSGVDATAGKGKPMIISEFGAGGIYGYRSFTKVKWTEDRQADITKEIITKYAGLDYLSGLILWQYCDGRVDNEWAMNRPKTQNNKGVVDIYRQPKLAYYTIKECFEAIKTRP